MKKRIEDHTYYLDHKIIDFHQHNSKTDIISVELNNWTAEETRRRKL